MPDIEGLLCALLRGELPAWPPGQDESFAAVFVERAEHHGVLPLLHHVFHLRSPQDLGWPAAVLDACREKAIAHTMWEMQHQHLLGQVLNALSAAGIKPVLIKGVVLAYTLYPNPAVRTRADTDLIVSPQDRFRAADILKANGFLPEQSVSAKFASYEASFVHGDGDGGFSHMLDLHWRIHYSQLQSRLLPYETLLQRARPLAALSPAALGVDPVYALLIACLHRANDLSVPQWTDGGATYGSERLIWLYDFHLLIKSLTPDQLAEFTTLAEQKGLRETCWTGIDKARACFNTPLPEEAVAALSRNGATEAVVRYQHSGMLRQRWMDWLALQGTRNRAGYLFEHAFPPLDYLRTRFPDARHTWAPLLYVRRLTEGVERRLRHRSS